MTDQPAPKPTLIRAVYTARKVPMGYRAIEDHTAIGGAPEARERDYGAIQLGAVLYPLECTPEQRHGFSILLRNFAAWFLRGNDNRPLDYGDRYQTERGMAQFLSPKDDAPEYYEWSESAGMPFVTVALHTGGTPDQLRVAGRDYSRLPSVTERYLEFCPGGGHSGLQIQTINRKQAAFLAFVMNHFASTGDMPTKAAMQAHWSGIVLPELPEPPPPEKTGESDG